jgi:hypothetical protein
MSLNPFDLISGVDINASRLDGKYSPNDSKNIKQKRYRKLMRGVNIYSYSTFSTLHACERKTACSKLEASRRNAEDFVFESVEENVDFAFGRAMESGVQAALLDKTVLLYRFGTS